MAGTKGAQETKEAIKDIRELSRARNTKDKDFTSVPHRARGPAALQEGCLAFPALRPMRAPRCSESR